MREEETFCVENATDAHLQWLLIVGICVANKPAKRMVALAEELLRRGARGSDDTPFECLYQLGNSLREELEDLKTGQYTRIEKALARIIYLDPRTCSLEDLEAVPGIGPKTARWFLMRTRPGVRLAALDTHILKWLRGHGYDVPKNTPTGRRYRHIEQIFLAECDRRDKTPAELDLEIWRSYADA